MRAVKRHVPFADVVPVAVAMLIGFAFAYARHALGIPASWCWVAFALIVLARVTHGWMLVRRAAPVEPAPRVISGPLDALTLGMFFAAIYR